jgi:uncharacterized membrane protein YdjX (TVP38/TMEM64 family)
MKKPKDSLLKFLSLAGFPLLFVAILVVIALNFQTIFGFFKDTKEIRDLVKSSGIWGPLIFIGLQIVQVVVFIIPGEVTQFAGGFIFGTWIGTLLSVIGIVIGSAINFYIGKLLGIPFVKALFKKEQIDTVESLISSSKSQKIGTLVIFGIFLIPAFPKDVITYVAGLTPMRFSVFLFVSGLGRLPGILVSSIMGENAEQQNWIIVIIVAVLGIGLFIAGTIFREQIFNFFNAKLKQIEEVKARRTTRTRKTRPKKRTGLRMDRSTD